MWQKFFTEEQNMIRELTRKFTVEKIIPVRRELDENEEFPWELVKEMAKLDLFRIFIPEQYNGLGGGVLDLAIAVEEMARGCAGVATTYAANALAAFPIILYGTDEQKRKYLPPIANGEKLAAFALTEPEAGSDAGNVKTRAVREGDHYIITGRKQWITNGGEADIYVVIASTNPDRGARGLSAFIMEKGMKGFDFGKKEKKMGIRASVTRELIFDDVKVPKDNLLGRENLGFVIAMRTFDYARPGVGALAVGIAEAALEEAVRFAKTRHQFGQPISSFEGIQFMIAEMGTKIEAARSLVYMVSKYIDSGEKDISKYSAMAKLFASDVAMEVTTKAVQIMGGYGYMREYPVEKMMRDAKITQIYEGTNEIQKLVIAAKLIREIV